jgi:ubiquinone/menaquinone biosynthesis C-methylase UbiE
MFQTKHDILPDHTHDEFAREEFCGTMRKFFTETLWPGNNDVYHGKQLPEFEARHGRKPQTRSEVKELMEETFYYRCSNLFGRVAQEQLWDTVGESIERQLPGLIEKAKPKPAAIGSLELHPEMPMPKYIESVDIHVMPGNFQTELCEGDVYQGALYDRGVYYFSYGGMGAENDKLGVAMATYTKSAFPDLKPARILDMGAGMGFSTLPWKDTYPDAEVYGVDLGAPMMRYAHARAESWGKKIHFSQQNAVETNFEDGFFDIVTHCLLTHEMPVKEIRRLFKEAFRLLAPGGIMVMDGGKNAKLDPERELFASWFTNNVNEPFASGMSRLDFEETLVETGFKPDNIVYSGPMQAVYLKGMAGANSVSGKKGEKQSGWGSAYTVAIK